jgi:ribonuclease D
MELQPQQAAVLKELSRYRDQAARQSNRPLFKVIGDKTLVEIAAQCPNSLEGLGQIPGMTEGQVGRHGRALLAAIECGLMAAPIWPPRGRRPDDQYMERLEALRTWRKNMGRKMGVNSDVVLPRDLMHTLARCQPDGAAEVETALAETPWRRAHFGEAILEVLRNPRANLG